MDIFKTLKYCLFPEQTFVISNGYLNEVEQVLYSLDNVYVDISSAEKQDTSYLCKNMAQKD